MVRLLTEIQKISIVSKLENGWSIRAIASEYNINKCSVMKVKKRWENERTISRKHGSGRFKRSNEQQDEALINYLQENPFETAVNAVLETNFPASRSTACRRIKNSILKCSSAAKKYKLTEEKNKNGSFLHFLMKKFSSHVMMDIFVFIGLVGKDTIKILHSIQLNPDVFLLIPGHGLVKEEWECIGLLMVILIPLNILRYLKMLYLKYISIKNKTVYYYSYYLI